MSERDELRGVVNRADWTARAEEIADAILSAGYWKPRTITTAGELEALTDSSVVLDGGDLACRKYTDGVWDAAGELVTSETVVLPAVVLWEPKS